MAEGIAALAADQAAVEQQIERIAQGGEMPPQVSAGSITDAHLLDQGGIMQTALLQIADRFRMAVELELIEGGRFLQQPGDGSGREFLLEKRDRLAERQIEEELDKADQVAAAAAAVAVEQILAALTMTCSTSPAGGETRYALYPRSVSPLCSTMSAINWTSYPSPRRKL